MSFVSSTEHSRALTALEEQTHELREARLLLQDLTHSSEIVERLRRAPALLEQVRDTHAEAVRAHEKMLATLQEHNEHLPKAISQQDEMIGILKANAERLQQTQATLDAAVSASSSDGTAPSPAVDPPGTTTYLTAMADQLTLATTDTSILNFGAKADGVQCFGNISAGTSSFTSVTSGLPAAVFQSSDIGKLICIRGAAAAGADLITTIADVPQPGSNSCKVSVAASTTVSAARCFYATDDAAAIAAAIATMIPTGGTINCPSGYIGHSGPIDFGGMGAVSLSLFRSLTFQGEGGATYSPGGSAATVFWNFGAGPSTKSYTQNVTGLHLKGILFQCLTDIGQANFCIDWSNVNDASMEDVRAFGRGDGNGSLGTRPNVGNGIRTDNPGIGQLRLVGVDADRFDAPPSGGFQGSEGFRFGSEIPGPGGTNGSQSGNCLYESLRSTSTVGFRWINGGANYDGSTYNALKAVMDAQTCHLTAGVTLPVGTLPVDSTSGFSASGQLVIGTFAAGQVLTYTGITPTSFTGVTGGAGAIANGTLITQKGGGGNKGFWFESGNQYQHAIQSPHSEGYTISYHFDGCFGIVLNAAHAAFPSGALPGDGTVAYWFGNLAQGNRVSGAIFGNSSGTVDVGVKASGGAQNNTWDGQINPQSQQPFTAFFQNNTLNWFWDNAKPGGWFGTALDYQMDAQDDGVTVSASKTVTLPPLTTAMKRKTYTVKNFGAAITVTVTTGGTNKIDTGGTINATSTTITSQGAALNFQLANNQSDWVVVSAYP